MTLSQSSTRTLLLNHLRAIPTPLVRLIVPFLLTCEVALRFQIRVYRGPFLYMRHSLLKLILVLELAAKRRCASLKLLFEVAFGD